MNRAIAGRALGPSQSRFAARRLSSALFAGGRPWILAACAAVTLAVGCDEAGDRAAIEANAQAAAVRAAGVPVTDERPQDVPDIVQQLRDAAASDRATPAVIQSQQSLGQVLYTQAQAATAELTRKEAEAEELAGRIGRLASEAHSNLLLAANYRKLDPKAGVAEIDKISEETRADALASTQQKKSQLDAEIVRLQAAIDAATGERDAALAEAGRGSAVLESLSGEQRTATVRMIAAARARAAAAARIVSEQSGLLLRARAESAEQDAVAVQLNAAIETLGSQSASLTNGFEALKASAATQEKLARATFDGEGDSIKTLSERLAGLLKDIDTRRGEIEQQLQGAIAASDKARGTSQRFSSQLAGAEGSNEAVALKRAAATVNPDQFGLDKAIAERALANLYADQGRALAQRLAIAGTVRQVGGALNLGDVEPLNVDKLKADLTQSLNKAIEASKQAAETIEGVALANDDLSGLRPLKAVTKVLLLNEQAQLAEAAAAHGVESGLDAKKLREDAGEVVREAVGSNLRLPAISESLGGLPPRPVAASDVTPSATAEPDSPEVAEIRQQIRDLVAKGMSPDAGPESVDELLARIKTPEGLAPAVENFKTLMLSSAKVHTAVREKFGEEGVRALQQAPADGAAPGAIPTAEQIEQHIAALPIKAIDDSTAEIALPPMAPDAPALSIKLLKEEDVWKVDLSDIPEPMQGMIGMISGMLTPITQGMDQLAADIEAGKYATVDEVRTALHETVTKSAGGLVPGATPPSDTPTDPAP